jgi:hypothetical protein
MRLVWVNGIPVHFVKNFHALTGVFFVEINDLEFVDWGR